MKVIGKITICMGMVYIYGEMGENMKDITNLIRNMVSVYIHGLMEESTKETGYKVNSMVKVNTF